MIKFPTHSLARLASRRASFRSMDSPRSQLSTLLHVQVVTLPGACSSPLSTSSLALMGSSHNQTNKATAQSSTNATLFFVRPSSQQSRFFSSGNNNNNNDDDADADDMSSSSHSDFAPQRKTVSNDIDEAQKMIAQHVAENHVMLYMKGTPSMPRCGFSAQVVRVLQNEGVDFASVNVLDYPTIREGVKKFSDWPTIPQLYVNGEFIGGCDIIMSMHDSGELKELFSKAEEESK